MFSHLPIFPVLFPLFVAILIPLVARKKNQIPWALCVGATGISFISSVLLLKKVFTLGPLSYWLGNWEPPWGIEYSIDVFSGFVLVVVSFMAFLISVYSRQSIQKEIPERKISFFYAVFMLLVAGLLGMVATGDLFNLYVFLEISAISSYVLIACGRQREALMASYNYLILGTIGATFILLGMGYLYMNTGTLNMADLNQRLPPVFHSKVVLTGFAFLTVGLSIKVALFPFHFWLPNAYTYAPSVVSAFLAATATKVSAYALIRIMFNVFTVDFNQNVVPISEIFLVLSAAAMIVGPLLAIGQTDIRRMLAYSSVGQIGYIIMGVALINPTAMVGSILHIMNHALMKGTLFLVVGVLIYQANIIHIEDLKGMGKRMPFTMAALTIAALSMVGIPLTVGFVSKWYLALGGLEAGRWFVVPVILTSSLLTAVYFWRVLETVYFKGEESGGEKAVRSEAPMQMLVPTLLASALCLFFGIFASVPVSITKVAAEILLGIQ